jgi:hypothetical protein
MSTLVLIQLNQYLNSVKILKLHTVNPNLMKPDPQGTNSEGEFDNISKVGLYLL